MISEDDLCRDTANMSLDDKEVEQKIIAEFLCPVCYNYIFPDAKMCVNGHTTCRKCWRKLTVCPICRGLFRKGKLYILENVFNKLTVPCPHEGCEEKIKGAVLLSHLIKCDHVAIECPLKCHRCRWSGSRGHLEEHLKKQHLQNLYFDTPTSIYLCGLGRPLPESYFQLYVLVFCVYDRIFRIILEFYIQSNSISINICEIGGRNEEHETYSIDIFSIRESTSSIELLSSGLICYNDDMDVSRTHRFILPDKMLSKLIIDNDGLWLKVAISRLESQR